MPGENKGYVRITTLQAECTLAVETDCAVPKQKNGRNFCVPDFVLYLVVYSGSNVIL